jgi:hypothetical protein
VFLNVVKPVMGAVWGLDTLIAFCVWRSSTTTSPLFVAGVALSTIMPAQARAAQPHHNMTANNHRNEQGYLFTTRADYSPSSYPIFPAGQPEIRWLCQIFQ